MSVDAYRASFRAAQARDAGPCSRILREQEGCGRGPQGNPQKEHGRDVITKKKYCTPATFEQLRSRLLDAFDLQRRILHFLTCLMSTAPRQPLELRSRHEYMRSSDQSQRTAPPVLLQVRRKQRSTMARAYEAPSWHSDHDRGTMASLTRHMQPSAAEAATEI